MNEVHIGNNSKIEPSTLDGYKYAYLYDRLGIICKNTNCPNNADDTVEVRTMWGTGLNLQDGAVFGLWM